MKKLIITSVAVASCMAVAPASHAQGTVNFNSSTSPTPCITSNSLTGATSKITAANYTFGLYFASTAAGLANSLTPVITLSGSGFPGGISGNSTLTIPGFTAGSVEFFEVKGWTTAGGSTYEAASISAVSGVAAGVSSIGQVTLGGGSVLAGVIFGPDGGATPGGTTIASPVLLTPVPEPSTMVLGGLGIAALAFFRRRK